MMQRTRPLPQMIGMLTAAQAFAPVAQAVAQHDPVAWLLHVIGLDIDGQGRAESWQFRYCLPALRLRLRFVVTICSEDLPVALGVNCLHEQHMPFPAPGSTLDQLRQRNAVSSDELDALWAEQMAAERALPLPFRDSPDAVHALIAQGVDLITGSTTIALSTTIDAAGRVLWQLHDRDTTYQTEFVFAR